MSDKPIVTVHVDPTILELKPSEAEVAILCDRTLEEVVDFATAHPFCFVFPFYTKRVEDAPDFGPVRNMGDVADYIVLPHYVGNFKSPREIITKIMDVFYEDCLRTLPTTFKVIHDETPP